MHRKEWQCVGAQGLALQQVHQPRGNPNRVVAHVVGLAHQVPRHDPKAERPDAIFVGGDEVLTGTPVLFDGGLARHTGVDEDDVADFRAHIGLRRRRDDRDAPRPQESPQRRLPSAHARAVQQPDGGAESALAVGGVSSGASPSSRDEGDVHREARARDTGGVIFRGTPSFGGNCPRYDSPRSLLLRRGDRPSHCVRGLLGTHSGASMLTLLKPPRRSEKTPSDAKRRQGIPV